VKKYVVLLIVILILLGAGLLHGGGAASVPPEPAPAVAVAPEDEDVRPSPAYALAYTMDESITLTFSEGGHFFSRGVMAAITASHPGATIYYTLDGSHPSHPTSASRRYMGTLLFPAPEAGLRVVVVRAVAVYGEYTSGVFTHTYFIGADIDERFGADMLVFSLAADPYDLFDHYSGILVPGFLREQWIAMHPRRNIVPTDPANFNWRGREGERPVHVEVFSPDGERLLVQRAGIRAHGAWSRAYAQLSLRLVPRREYEPGRGQFHFPFFPGDMRQDGSGNPIRRYDSIILRNGGNDRRFGMLRNEVGSLLAREVGLPVVTPVRPAAVFLNGEYWGFAWLQVRIDAHYLQEMFDAPTRSFDVVHQGELWIDTDCPVQREAIEYKNAFAGKNLRDDAVFARLEAILDIEDMLRYYAFKIFMGAEDWPHNNLRRWRYTGPQTEGLPPQLDGRWRYVVVDLDWTLGLYGPDHNLPTFRRVLEDRNNYGALLRNVLTRPDMLARFAQIMEEVIDTVTATAVQETIAHLFAQSEGEIDHALAAGKYEHWVNRYTITQNHENMIRFARGRGRVMREGLARLMG